MRHAWVFVLCLYGCSHGAAPDTLHYFSCIPKPAHRPCQKIIRPALIYSGPADGSFWGDGFYGPGAMPGYGGDVGPLSMP